ncbi:response regulator transcription factor [Sphingomonas sp. UYP23]
MSAPIDPGQGQPQRIAIVDDDASVRRAMGNLVESLGYQAQVFDSGRSLLEEDLSRFGCVISDLQMPGMSGLELQRALIDVAPDMPFVVMTAFAEERLRKRALNAGARAFLEKPCDVDGLIELIAQIVGPPEQAV